MTGEWGEWLALRLPAVLGEGTGEQGRGETGGLPFSRQGLREKLKGLSGSPFLILVQPPQIRENI